MYNYRHRLRNHAKLAAKHIRDSSNSWKGLDAANAIGTWSTGPLEAGAKRTQAEDSWAVARREGSIPSLGRHFGSAERQERQYYGGPQRTPSELEGAPPPFDALAEAAL